MINHGRPEPFVSTLGIVVGRGPNFLFLPRRLSCFGGSFFSCRINLQYAFEYGQF